METEYHTETEEALHNPFVDNSKQADVLEGVYGAFVTEAKTGQHFDWFGLNPISIKGYCSSADQG